MSSASTHRARQRTAFAALAVGLALIPPSAAAGQDATGTVYGRVLSGATGAPVRSATVRLLHRHGFRFVLSDEHGFYRAGGLPAGDVLVRASALDHAPLAATVRIPPGRAVPLDLELELRPVEVEALFTSIEADRYRLPAPGLTRGGLRSEGETELRALESSPGVAELGLTQTADGPDPGDPTNLLYVRGAATDLKLVLLDDAPVYAPFHLSGLLDAFPDGVLEDATLYAGGTPARYGGGLSYVLDLELRDGDPNRFRTAGSVDVLGVGGRVEGPLAPGARILLGARALHGAGYSMVTGASDLPYGYGDALGRLTLDVGAGRLGLTGFWNRESVELDLGKLEGAAPESAFWGNTAGSLRYEAPLGGGTLHVTTAYGRFGTRIPILDEEAEGPVPFTIGRGQNARTRSEAFYESGRNGFHWAAGAGFDTHETILDQRTVFGDTTAHEVARALGGSAWAEAGWMVAPRVELQVGLRADLYEPAGRATLSPRATARWLVDERSALKLSVGRFSQIMRGPESILSSDLTGPTRGTPGAIAAPAPAPGSLFAVAGATHVVVGLTHRPREGVDVGLEGYFKDFDGLPGASSLYSSGADLWVQASEGPVRGWIGYSLAWVWSDEGEDTRFVGRQLLSGGLTTDLRGFDLGLRLTYGAGLPFAEVRRDAEGPPGTPSGAEAPEEPAPALSGAPDDSYLRLDAEISRRLFTTLAGSRLEIAPYIRLLNALDRRDALFYRAEEEGPTRTAPLASVPLLAVVGVAWAF